MHLVPGGLAMNGQMDYNQYEHVQNRKRRHERSEFKYDNIIGRQQEQKVNFSKKIQKPKLISNKILVQSLTQI